MLHQSQLRTYTIATPLQTGHTKLERDPPGKASLRELVCPGRLGVMCRISMIWEENTWKTSRGYFTIKLRRDVDSDWMMAHNARDKYLGSSHA